MADQPSIYQQCVAAGVPTHNNSSDLYIPVNDVTTKLVQQYQFRQLVSTFTNQVEGGTWFSIPFAYEPFWEAAAERSRERAAVGDANGLRSGA